MLIVRECDGAAKVPGQPVSHTRFGVRPGR
jgi:hypothetical protein